MAGQVGDVAGEEPGQEDDKEHNFQADGNGEAHGD